ncbi:DNA-binding response OmpR family regulator [Nocardioides sp. BE266]|uniref:response regulator transcription factor n=1 Tax=Nocardioides sp. BE266 TaxID=2817725 RepID=UPI002862FF1C|nr:response regulator transcription factor [Nocardioides sp. BE266]MDR7254743.1 DNA-binding response OmpR family regulator [Nocardioides sp. BE266]
MDQTRGLVLVVEDEPAISDLVRRYLTAAGFGVHLETDVAGALGAVRRLRPAVVLLDVGLPDGEGTDVCRAMRDASDWTPVLFVTARDDEVERVLGLELGADDYVTKPFSPRELVARVKTVVRRSSAPTGPRPVRDGAVTLDPGSRTLTVDGATCHLTATEFNLLEVLMGSPGKVFDRAELLSRAWGHADYGTSRTVDVYVAQLRAKLGEHCPVETVRGVGYRARSRS